MKPSLLYEKRSIKDKTIIVTGGNSGIGLFTILEALKQDAHVIMAVRSLQRGEQAKQFLSEKISTDKLTILQLDVSSLTSVDKVANLLIEKNIKIDTLINNAGIMFGSFSLTEDGFESQLATNHFGHFAFTAKLWNQFSDDARVINVSSIAHRRGKIDLSTLHDQHTYSPWGAYSRSKLANLWFTLALAHHLQHHHSQRLSLAAHPGVAKTKLLFKEKKQPIYNVFKAIIPLQSAEKGALPIIRALLDAHAKQNDYFGPSSWNEFSGPATRVKRSKEAEKLQEALAFFTLSETLTKVKFPF